MGVRVVMGTERGKYSENNGRLVNGGCRERKLGSFGKENEVGVCCTPFNVSRERALIER
jgi:hypothetical protein